MKHPAQLKHLAFLVKLAEQASATPALSQLHKGLLTILILLFGTTVQAQPCSMGASYLDVDTSTSRLYLCQNGLASKSFSVALGKGGLDKKAKGDGRTPIGTYPLGSPRTSNRFFKFVPIGYPTADQKTKGYTGSDVGVHGPFRYFSWLGRLNTWVNWTDGCIATGSNDEISEIAVWIDHNQVNSITIH